jgi:hypothetical protein
MPVLEELVVAFEDGGDVRDVPALQRDVQHVCVAVIAEARHVGWMSRRRGPPLAPDAHTTLRHQPRAASKRPAKLHACPLSAHVVLHGLHAGSRGLWWLSKRRWLHAPPASDASSNRRWLACSSCRLTLCWYQHLLWADVALEWTCCAGVAACVRFCTAH